MLKGLCLLHRSLAFSSEATLIFTLDFWWPYCKRINSFSLWDLSPGYRPLLHSEMFPRWLPLHFNSCGFILTLPAAEVALKTSPAKGHRSLMWLAWPHSTFLSRRTKKESRGKASSNNTACLYAFISRLVSRRLFSEGKVRYSHWYKKATTATEKSDLSANCKQEVHATGEIVPLL